MRRSERARILVFTGPGKGKTTAALGMALRSLSSGRRVLLVRFAKARHSGEVAFLGGCPGVEIVSGQCGMTPPPDSPLFPAHVAAARELFAQAERLAPGHDLVILDELCGMVARGMIGEDEVKAFALRLRSGQCLVLTGRGAGAGLVALADTVSVMEAVKHGYQQGIAAQEGVEF